MHPYLQVSRQALRHNAAAIINYVQTPVIGVLKNDGYGVSLLEASRAWRDNGVTMLAVSKSEDAIALRGDGFDGDILMLSPIADRKILEDMVNANIILPITSITAAEFYSKNSRVPVRVHVAIDTGMGRFGIHWANISELYQVYETKNLCFLGIYSHFSAAFEKSFQKTKRQLDRFLSICKHLEGKNFPIGLRHIANSCAALRFPETRLDAVRIGSALVGQTKAPLILKQAALCVAPVIDCKHLQPGDTIGYGAVCVAKKHMNVIVVAIGHENGMGLIATPDNYPAKAFIGYVIRLLRTVPFVEYREKQLKLVGRAGNQFSLFDAGDLKIKPGEVVYVKPNLMVPWQRRFFL